jgi:hypothetical protein
MRYLLLICGDESAQAAMSPAEGATLLAAYEAYANEMGGRGILRGGERLRPTSDATTVSVREGKVVTADGPFAETKEQIGGYFIVECDDIDEAIKAAAEMPGAKTGSIEVRPIWDM